MNETNSISIKDVLERDGAKIYRPFVEELEELKGSDGDPNVAIRLEEIKEELKPDLEIVPLLRSYQGVATDIKHLDELIFEISNAEKIKAEKQRRTAEAKQDMKPFEGDFAKYLRGSVNVRGLKKLRKRVRKISCSTEEMIVVKDSLCDRIDDQINSSARVKKGRNRFTDIADEHMRSELGLLTEDKGYVGAFFTNVSYKIGFATVEKEMKKRAEDIENSIVEYKTNGKRLCYDLENVRKDIQQYSDARDSLFGKLELVQEQITDEKLELKFIKSQYREKFNGTIDNTVEKEAKKLRRKIGKKQTYVENLERHQTDISHDIEIDKAKIDAARLECYNLKFRIKQNEQNMYDRIETLKNRVYPVVDAEEIKQEGKTAEKAKINEENYKRFTKGVNAQGKQFMEKVSDAYSKQKRPEKQEVERDFELKSKMDKQAEAVAKSETELEQRVVGYKGMIAQESLV